MSPLNWGLGHVCRTIPIIKWLLDNKNEIIICCDANQEQFYRNYFPEIWYVPHEGYPFKFNGNGNWTLDILKNIGSLHSFLKDEKRRVAELVEKFNPDLILSDQRFGFISKSVKSIIISHQLNLPVQKWNILAKIWNRILLSAFDEIWVPDTASQKYSGKLSNGKYKNKYFIGTCTRFCESKKEYQPNKKAQFRYLGIVSGPTPYNQQLLELLIEKLKQSSEKSTIIVPTELYHDQLKESNINIISAPNHVIFAQLLKNSKTVISRAGYTTIMDLVETQNEAILIPTPGQVEQEYLYELHKNHSKWKFIIEEHFKNIEL
ncbi:glycosyltransferase [Brumimicrobium mesophilum]|uniref:glycosyltransferase n=1 Tax=Brumimicrobium mesophilum TaxID=392717 RepID=UPI00131CC264|nr:glycosyltransferase [Brumimicrobium mesophilum]